MLAGLDRHDVAEQAVGLRFPQVDIERGVAQHEPDHHIVGAVLVDEARQRHRLGFRGDDRLFGEHLNARLEPRADVAEVHVVGRADHQQVEVFPRQHGFERVVGGADVDVVLFGVGQAERLWVDMRHHREAVAQRR